MEPRHLTGMIEKLNSVTDEQMDHMVRAITEKGDLLERLHSRDGCAAVNTLRRDEDATEEKLDVRDGVAHIPIAGTMMKQVPSIFNWLGVKATSTEATSALLDLALNRDDVESIQLDVDSPGGTVDGTAALADDIAAIATLKPVKAVVTDLAASAAYWVASQANEIEIGKTADIGSIGVYTVVDDVSEAYQKKGVKTHVISNHQLKGSFVQGTAATDEQLADLGRVINSTADVFVDAVASGRRVESSKIAALATGQIWVGQHAVDIGLADGLLKSREMPERQSFSYTKAAGAAQESGMTEEERKEMERLQAENRALKERAEADRVRLEVANAARVEALLSQYADRIPPASADSVANYVKSLPDHEAAEKFLQSLPQVDRPDRQSADLKDVAEVAEKALGDGAEKLAKVMQQSVARLDDMCKIGGAVDRVEREIREDENGKLRSIPVAVMKDGRRLERSEMRKELGIKGALFGLLICLVPGLADAAALTAERATECRLSGITKRYLMAASETVYAGGLVMIDSDGKAMAAAAEASNKNVAGVAQETKTAAASGSTWIKVSDSVICKFAGTTLGQDDVGSIVYAEDDQTVDETIGANEPIAGILVEYVSASAAWIYVSSLVNFDRLDPDAAVALTSTLTVTGATELNGGLAMDTNKFTVADTTGNTLVAGTFDADGDATLSGGAGALTFDDSDSSVVMPDNDSTALAIGSTGVLNAMSFDTTDDAENVVFNAGVSAAAVSITGATTLDYSNCGKTHFVTAGIDTESITLPALATVTTGCELTFMYVGADAGALLDISPNASDGIEGTCTLAAAIVTFSGANDADIGLTKGTGIQGDSITLVAGNADDWYVKACSGIWANN